MLTAIASISEYVLPQASPVPRTPLARFSRVGSYSPSVDNPVPNPRQRCSLGLASKRSLLSPSGFFNPFSNRCRCRSLPLMVLDLDPCESSGLCRPILTCRGLFLLKSKPCGFPLLVVGLLESSHPGTVSRFRLTAPVEILSCR